MGFPKFFLSTEILDQIEGVESGLRQRKQLGTISQFVFIFITALQIVNSSGMCGENLQTCVSFFGSFPKISTPANDQTADSTESEAPDNQEAENSNDIGAPFPWIPFLFLLNVFSLSVWIWSKQLLQESKNSFRYTYSIEAFPAKEDNLTEAKLAWLEHDLLERLNEKVGRLSWLENPASSGTTDDGSPGKDNGSEPDINAYKSHIHIGGYYLIRKELREENQWLIEVTPWVRIGASDNPKALSEPVKFRLKSKSIADQTEEGINQLDASGGSQTPTSKDNGNTQEFSKEGSSGLSASDHKQSGRPPKLSREEYETLLERVYSSLTTLVYEQIRKDVKTKIDLLPTNYYKATAYFYEAEDYANSNTLYAYQRASELYREAMNLYDAPQWKPKLKGEWHKLCQRWGWRLTLRPWHPQIRQISSKIWPRLGRYEVMTARAEIGYATVLIYQSILSTIVGQRSQPSYAARPVISKAIGRLEGINKNVAERDIHLFNAYVTQALIWSYSGEIHRAQMRLLNAQNLLPSDAQDDFQYLFASGLAAEGGRRHWTRSLLRQSTELKPSFELAQLFLAITYEMLWRTRPTLERKVAENIFEEYEKVLRLDPGNLSAWANRGYMRWLLGSTQDIEKAIEDFKSGCDYKHIKHDIFVAQLDYGLARIAAEQGNFQEAYDYYTKAISALLAQGYLHKIDGINYNYHYFEFIDKKIYQRFENYKQNVETFWNLSNRINDQDLLQLKNLDKATFKGAINTLRAVNSQGNSIEKKKEYKIISFLKELPEESLGLSNHLCSIESILKQTDKSLNLNYEDHRKLDFIARAIDFLISDEEKQVPEDFFSEISDLIRKISSQLGSQRIRRSVYAFVLNDYGDAAYYYYIRTSDSESYRRAIKAYKKAREVHKDYIFPHYNLGFKLEGDLEEDYEKVFKEDHKKDSEKVFDLMKNSSEEINRIASEWPYGKFARAALFFKRKKYLEDGHRHINSEINKLNSEIDKLNESNKINKLNGEINKLRASIKELEEAIEKKKKLAQVAPSNKTDNKQADTIFREDSESRQRDKSRQREKATMYQISKDIEKSAEKSFIEEDSKKEYLKEKMEELEEERKKELLDQLDQKANLDSQLSSLKEILSNIVISLNEEAYNADELEQTLMSLIPKDLKEEVGLLSENRKSSQENSWRIPKKNKYSSLQEKIEEIHIQSIRYLGKFFSFSQENKTQAEEQEKNNKKALDLWNYIQTYYLPYDFDLFLDINELAKTYSPQSSEDEYYFLNIFPRLVESREALAQIIQAWRLYDEDSIGILNWLDEEEIFSKTDRLRELSKVFEKKGLPENYINWFVSELRGLEESEKITLEKLKILMTQGRKDVWAQILERLTGTRLRVYKKLAENLKQGNTEIYESDLRIILDKCKSSFNIRYLIKKLELHQVDSVHNIEWFALSDDASNRWLEDFWQESSKRSSKKSLSTQQIFQLILTKKNITTIQTWVKENILQQIKDDLSWLQNNTSKPEEILFKAIRQEINSFTSNRDSVPDLGTLTNLSKSLEEEAQRYKEGSQESVAKEILTELIQIYEEEISDDFIKENLLSKRNELFVSRILHMRKNRNSFNVSETSSEQRSEDDCKLENDLLIGLKIGYDSKEKYLESKRLTQYKDRNGSLSNSYLYDDALGSTLEHYHLMRSKIPRDKQVIDRTIPIPALKPIRLEIAIDLVDADSMQSGEHPLVKDYPEGLRADIQTSMGVLIPGVQVWDNNRLQNGEYIISFYGVLCGQGIVKKDNTFILATKRELNLIGIKTQSEKSSQDPVSQGSGFWIRQNKIEAVKQRNTDIFKTFVILDPYQFMVRHLKHLLSQHLDKFLGIQDVYDLLQTWHQALLTDTQTALAKRLQEDPKQLAISTRLFQELLREGIPLNNPQELLTQLEKSEPIDNYDEKITYLKTWLK